MHVYSVFVLLSAIGICTALFGSNSNVVPELEKGWEHVTAGSTIKLSHVKSNARLMMPQVSYGTGSQQQAITAHLDAAATKGLWRVEVKGSLRGQPVLCGAQIRLINSDTDHGLHSHSAHKSPISSNQEVSGYDGRDTGDLWTVECSQEKWMRETPVVFKHVDTSKYLLSLPNKKFGQPISGHQEVCAGKNADSNAQWMALEGYYFSRRLNEAK